MSSELSSPVSVVAISFCSCSSATNFICAHKVFVAQSRVTGLVKTILMSRAGRAGKREGKGRKIP